MKKNFTLLISLLVFSQLLSCAREEKQFEYTKVDKRLEQIRRQQIMAQQAQQQQQFELNNTNEEIEKAFPAIEGFCSQINKDSFDSPFEYEKIFANLDQYRAYVSTLELFDGIDDKCTGTNVIFNRYPISIVEYELENKNNLYIAFRVNKERKVESMFPFFKDGFTINYQDVKMRDGNTLSSVSFERNNVKAKTILHKSPYFHTDSFSYFVYEALKWSALGYNYVVQSNRGSHASTGNFKWLHEKNVTDSADSIKWITQQSFSNGKVIARGVSYDGFNALSAAVGDPEGLEAVVACSAPANASTDSFTGGQTVEYWLLNYIANREFRDGVNLYMEKMSYLSSQNIPLAEYDNHIFGRDIADWQDLIEAKEKGSLKEYFSSRSLLEGLAKTNTPIFHIAGTNEDQDSLDTVLAYNYVQKNDADPSNHRLYIHHDGHGCGDFDTTLGETFLSENREELAKEYIASEQLKGPMIVDEKSFESRSVNISLTDDTLEKTILNDRYDVLEGKDLALGAIVDSDLIVNGPLSIEIESMYNMYNSNVVVEIYYTVNSTPQRIHWQLSGSSRSSFFLERKSASPEVLKLDLPPVKFEVKEGELIYVVLKTSFNDYLDIFREQRDEYYSLDETRGQFRVLSNGKNKINLSVELSSQIEEVSDLSTSELLEEVLGKEVESKSESVEKTEESTTETNVETKIEDEIELVKEVESKTETDTI